MLGLKLKPLRIVSGWMVFSNRLYDLNCIDLSTSEGQKIYKAYYLDNGLLTLRNDNISLYIDWLPPMDSDGCYILSAQNDENLKKQTIAESIDLDEICSRMEGWILNIYPKIAANFLK